MRSIVWAFVALLLASGVDRAAAESQTASDFKRYCVDTHADRSKAFAAADADGWGQDPGQSTTFMGLTGNKDGRVIASGTADFRALTAGQSIMGKAAVRKCFLISRDPFETVTTDLLAFLPVGVDKQTNSGWTWSYMSLNGVVRSMKGLDLHLMTNASARGPLVTVVAIKLNGGTILQYTELGSETTIAQPAPIPASAGDVHHFQAWIEQDGQRTPFAGEIHLSKHPFFIVFRGSKLLAYSVITSLDPDGLSGKTSEADLEGVFNPFAVGAEYETNAALNTFLSVNKAANGSTTNQLWSADLHRFQQVVADSKTISTARRNINSMIVGSGSQRETYTLDSFPYDKLYILVAGRPPEPGHPYTDPKFATLTFDK